MENSTIIQFVQTLSATIGVKDFNIQAHSEKIAKYSRK